MSLLAKREERTFSGTNFNPYAGTPYAAGEIPPAWWDGFRAVNEDSALRIAAVWECVRFLADYIACLPVGLVKQAGDTIVPLSTPALLVQPWPEWSRFEWFFAQTAALLLRGNCYGRMFDFDGLGYPRRIAPVHPDDVDVRRVDGELVYRFGREVVPTGEVFHVRAFVMPGKLKGLDPVQQFAQTMGIDLSAEKFGADFFDNGAHPTSVLESDQPVNEDQARTIKRRLMEVLHGSREPAVIGNGAKWRQIQVAPNESQFLDTLRFGKEQIASIFGFGVPTSAAESKDVTYANEEARGITLQTYTIMPWTQRWAEALTPLCSPKPGFVRFDLDARLRVDMVSRYTANSIGVRTGFLSNDDVRAREHMPPIADGEGEQYLWPPYANRFEMTEPNATITDDPTNPPAPGGP